MAGIVRKPFKTATRKFKPGDLVTREEVGDLLFNLCCEDEEQAKLAKGKVAVLANDKK